MKVFITGGGGFLGSAICKRLTDRRHSIVSFSRTHYPHLEPLGIDQRKGSIADLDAVVCAARGCDVMIHSAARTGVWGDADRFYTVNVVGTENCVAACRENGIRALVYTSSPSAVFSGGDMEGVDESVPYAEKQWAAYPRTKAMAEKIVRNANSAHLATIALRPHLIWGPGDPHLVRRIVDRGRRGKLRRIGTAVKRIDSVYVDNAAEAHVLALEQLNPLAACAGKAYFITNGEPLPVWDLVNRILRCAGLPPVTRTVSPWMAMRLAGALEWLYRTVNSESEPILTRFVVKELSTSHWFDISAARNDLGYHPAVSIDEGLNRLHAWFLRGGYSGMERPETSAITP
ncbi:NAD-dependent epimerase/dehydratase family protein [bacterium]|nr:NAD-dependent epimerase/dehydratase family protein [candidate division CSSED10-310 bacterium]